MRKIITTFILIIALIDGCKHDPIWVSPNTESPTLSSVCDPDTIYFLNSIGPLIASTCGTTGCHDSNGSAEGRNLTTYSGIMSSEWVIPNNGSKSKLYTYANYQITGKDPMPPSAPPMSANNINLLLKWINQGAKNNGCISECDTTQITYTSSLKPFIDLSCKGCHNTTIQSGSVNLDGHTNFSTHAERSLIRMRSSQNPMPPNGKPSECISRTVELWIIEGKPNN